MYYGCDNSSCSATYLQYLLFVFIHYFQTQGRESIAAKLVANLITEAGANRVLACDLHSGQSMGYFDIPVDHVHCQVFSLHYILFSVSLILFR